MIRVLCCLLLLSCDEALIEHEVPGADSDGDGLTNAEERELFTDPYQADSDRDGVNDGDEVQAGTDPLNAENT
jgi:hypothetical protein